MNDNPFTDNQEFNEILQPISYYGKPITNNVYIRFPNYQSCSFYNGEDDGKYISISQQGNKCCISTYNQAKYYDVDSQNCQDCVNNACHSCNNQTECFQCRYSEPQRLLPYCQQCPRICFNCQNSTQCDTCISEIRLEGNCQCPEQYFDNGSDGECQQCIQNCKICDNENTCIECYEQYNVDQNGFCKKSGSDGECQQNNLNCKICYNENLCIECDDQYIIDINEPSRCLKPALQESESDGECQQNNSNCKICDNENTCIECDEKYNLDQNGKCKKQAQQQKVCDYKCQTCIFKGGNSHCKICAGNRINPPSCSCPKNYEDSGQADCEIKPEIEQLAQQNEQIANFKKNTKESSLYMANISILMNNNKLAKVLLQVLQMTEYRMLFNIQYPIFEENNLDSPFKTENQISIGSLFIQQNQNYQETFKGIQQQGYGAFILTNMSESQSQKQPDQKITLPYTQQKQEIQEQSLSIKAQYQNNVNEVQKISIEDKKNIVKQEEKKNKVQQEEKSQDNKEKSTSKKKRTKRKGSFYRHKLLIVTEEFTSNQAQKEINLEQENVQKNNIEIQKNINNKESVDVI
ncbi:Insulin-like growth factor binding protein, N-terminal [Pseudocohnilembus persalinus]|uniref:Insulin-like growth factor binding protein, N-terminal n=1 Tax=Pseudocohnilembus persalinus TaxID=266149 RepID=A0A0V0QWA3_PSEPJ|nr:Insulin-like growth factor binding protein, N-terminal [Pseudocohnilembus persalinus]|eukprot:KRX06165.1 Insulin-like growth factor binding protein, N-terminal [Pseudocohnilembus persalinus]